MADIPRDEQLIEAVRAAGWILEQDAYKALERADCHPRSGWAFADPDEPSKSRELDVFGYRQLLRSDEHRVLVSAKFLFECKQSASPFAAIGQVLPEWHFRTNPTQHGLSLRVLPFRIDLASTVEVPSWRALGLREVECQHGDDGFRATQLTRLERKNSNWLASNDGVFTSLVFPLAKAIRATQGELNSVGVPPVASTVPRSKRSSWVNYDLAFCAVITSSPILVVDTTEDSPRVTQRPWVTARRQLQSKHVTGTFDVDVVSAQVLDDYIADRLRFADDVAAHVRGDAARFTGDSWSTPEYSELTE